MSGENGRQSNLYRRSIALLFSRLCFVCLHITYFMQIMVLQRPNQIKEIYVRLLTSITSNLDDDEVLLYLFLVSSFLLPI